MIKYLKTKKIYKNKMPYGRKTYRRRKRYNRRNYSLAKKAYRLAKKNASRVELKFLDTEAATAYDATGSVIQVGHPAQGDSQSNRNGDNITPTSLQFRAYGNINASATATQIRVIGYIWKQGSSTAATDIIESADIDSLKAFDKRYQSKMLFDKTMTLNAVSRPEARMNVRVKIPTKYRTAFQPGATTYVNNGLYLFIMSDEATNTPTLNWTARMIYKDA